jgi:hypothetical protein
MHRRRNIREHILHALSGSRQASERVEVRVDVRVDVRVREKSF